MNFLDDNVLSQYQKVAFYIESCAGYPTYHQAIQPKLVHKLIDRLRVRFEGARRKSQHIQPKMSTHRTMSETFWYYLKVPNSLSLFLPFTPPLPPLSSQGPL